MASYTLLTTARVREVSIIVTIRGCLVQHITCVRTLGAPKKKEETKMTKLDFHRFQVRHFSNTFEHCCAAVELGQRQRADISLFIATYNTNWRNISV